MKKTITFLLTATMMLGLLSACGGREATAPSDDSSKGGDASTELAYPEKDVQIVVPYAPGGGSDNLVRGMLQFLDIGATTVPINVEGAAGYIGALQLYNSKNDGYTIMTHNEMDIISYAMSGQAEVDLVGELEYICDVVADYNVMCTNTGSGWKTAQDAIDYCKENPGKVAVGTVGANNVNYASTMELLKAMGIYDLVTIVPYDGGAPCETALQGGHIQLEVNSLADTNAYIAAGSNVPLLICNTERIEAFPDLPSTMEAGYDVTYTKPRGFFAPAGTDQAILDYLSDMIAEVCEMPEFIEAMDNLGFTVDYVDGAAAKERTIAWVGELAPVFEEMSVMGS